MPGHSNGPRVRHRRNIISLKFPRSKVADPSGTSSTPATPIGNTNELNHCSAGFQPAVSQGFQPASRRIFDGLTTCRTSCRLEIGDTAGWKPALRGNRHFTLMPMNTIATISLDEAPRVAPHTASVESSADRAPSKGVVGMTCLIIAESAIFTIFV